MATLCGMTVIKKTTGYRGGPEEWSNTYHFTGGIPSDSTAWKALYDALSNQEKLLYTAKTTIVGGYGYDSDDPNAHAVWTYDATVPPNTPVAGTLTIAGGVIGAPLDCACWIRWGTDRMNSRGKRIYLRKYFHDVYSTGAPSDPDIFNSGQKTAYLAFGAKLEDGTFLDARKLRSRTHGDALLGHAASSYITTRTLKRRGKRPPT